MHLPVQVYKGRQVATGLAVALKVQCGPLYKQRAAAHEVRVLERV